MTDNDDDNGKGKAGAAGNGRPPKARQSEERRSDHPSRRPKKKAAKNFDLNEMLTKPRMVKINGKTRKMPAGELFFRTLLEGAIQGDPRAQMTLLRFMKKWNLFEAITPTPYDFTGVKEELMRKLSVIRANRTN